MTLEDNAAGMGKRVVDATSARQSFREIVDEAAHHGRRVVITRSGRPVAALVSIRDLDHLTEGDAKVDGVMISDHDAKAETVPFDEFLTLNSLRPQPESEVAGRTLGDVGAQWAIGVIAEAASGKAVELVVERVREILSVGGRIPDEVELTNLIEEVRSSDSAEIKRAAEEALAGA
jgi:prevent-host-death family protein